MNRSSDPSGRQRPKSQNIIGNPRFDIAPQSPQYEVAVESLRMNRAEVRISSRFAEGGGELFVRVEHFGLERFRIIRADYGVRDIVTVGPRNCGSDRHF